MSTAAEVSRRLVQLYGEDPAQSRGVLHAVAAWRSSASTLCIIRIGPGSPKSETDLFALRVARMRADAIVTTGKILRDEPGVRHRERDPSLIAWRREQVGRATPPRSVVLSSGRALDLAHPLLRTAHAPLVATGAAGARELRARAERESASGVEIVARPSPGIRDTLMLLEPECETVLIEAGPTTANELYREPCAVDELLLSVYESTELAPELVGAQLPELRRLEALFPQRSDPVSVDEASGRWTFQRWRAKRAPR